MRILSYFFPPIHCHQSIKETETERLNHTKRECSNSSLFQGLSRTSRHHRQFAGTFLCAASQNFVIDVHAVDDRSFIKVFGNDVLIKVAQSPFQPRCTI